MNVNIKKLSKESELWVLTVDNKEVFGWSMQLIKNNWHLKFLNVGKVFIGSRKEALNYFSANCRFKLCKDMSMDEQLVILINKITPNDRRLEWGD